MNLVFTLGLVAFAASLNAQGLQAGSPWPKTQANLQNDGNATSGGSNGSLRWVVPIAVSPGSAPVIAADNTIYVSSAGSLLAIDPTDGSQKWSYPTGALPGAQSSPVIGSNGVVYVAGNGAPLLRAILPSGTQKWQFSGLADNGIYQVTGAPTIGTDGTIYFAAEEFMTNDGFGVNQNYLFALNPDSSLKWSFKAGQPNVIQSSPAIGTDGTIYFGSSNTLNNAVAGEFYAINPKDGSVKWSFPTTGLIVSSPSIGLDGTIYIGEQGGTKNLYAVKPDGTRKIFFTANGSFVCPAAIASDSSLYFPTSDGAYYALDLGGNVKWSLSQGSAMASSTVIGSDGTIFYGTNSAQLIAGFQYGAGLWSFAAGGNVSTPLAVGGDGAIYFGGADGKLYAIGTEVNTIPVLSLSLNPTTVLGGSLSVATVTIQSNAPAGGDIVQLQSSDPSVTMLPFVKVAPGTKQISFDVFAEARTSDLTATITATSGGVTASATLLVEGSSLNSLSISPSSIVAPAGATGTVTLSTPAPQGGANISLFSTNSSISFPASVVVAAGATTATFSITTIAVSTTTTATIIANEGSASTSATLTLNPPSPISLNLTPSSVAGGSVSVGTLTLNGIAARGGLSVTLSSSSPSAIVPANFTIPSGSSVGTFTISTLSVSSAISATITAATAAAKATATLTINPSTSATLTLSPSSVLGGSTSTGTVTLTAPAPASGMVVKLSSSLTAAAKIPASVTIAKGRSSAQFTIQTSRVAATTVVAIRAQINTGTLSATLTINPPSLLSLTLKPTIVTGGSTSTATVTLTSAGPSAGITVKLASNRSTAIVPATIKIGSGATHASFTIKTLSVNAQTSATITASFNGVVQSAALTINPPALVSLKLSPESVLGGKSSTGTVTIGTAASTGGIAVNLSSNNSNAKVPASVVIGSGKKTATFLVTTNGVASQTSATITGVLGSTSKSATLTITPAVLLSITLSPTKLKGGASSTGTVTLNGPAPAGGAVVKLSSNKTTATPPLTVTVQAGQTKATFTVSTTEVTAQTAATISAELGSTTKSASLTITK